ncbi:MAG: hypothetical protein R2941_23895 [Desulfobacterales bacterium]
MNNFPINLCGRQHVCGSQPEEIPINPGMFQRNNLRRRLRQYGVSGVPSPAKSMPDLTFFRHKTIFHPFPERDVPLKQELFQKLEESLFFKIFPDCCPAHPECALNSAL